MSLPEILDSAIWRQVPDEACRLAKEAAGTYQVVKDLMPFLPPIADCVHYNPDTGHAIFNYLKDADSEKVASWHIALKQVPGVEMVEHGTNIQVPKDQPFMTIKTALEAQTIFKPFAQAAQLRPSWFSNLYGGPNPLAATIGGALLGAGMGYGGGWLAEQLLPEQYFNKGRLRKTMAVAGGLMGTAPGIWMAADNTRTDPPAKGFFNALLTPHPMQKDSKYKEAKGNLRMILPSESFEMNDMWKKAATDAGGMYDASIPVDQFGMTIWNDLRGTGGFTPAPIAAATGGLIQAASLSQGGVNLISPMDIARISLGAGSGWISSKIVGATLGALAGLKPEAQQALQRTGTWAGILSNTIPLAFSG